MASTDVPVEATGVSPHRTTRTAHHSWGPGTARHQQARTLHRVSPHHEYEPSPVPSDADLRAGDLPFTAWGQFEDGSIDLRVFDQGIWWVDINQRPHKLTEMSAQHLANVISHLLDHVDHFHQAQCRRHLIEMICDLLTGRPNTNLVAEAAGVPAVCDITPVNWLQGTPLMRALAAELARRQA